MSKKNFKKYFILIFTLFLLFIPSLNLAFSETENNTIKQHDITITILGLAFILLLARISSLIEYYGQPAVLGELVIGVILGNLGLLGFNFFDKFKQDPILLFLSELGVIILLFQIGLESNIEKMKKVGIRAFLVACLGVAAPFILGTYIIGPKIFPALSSNAYIFLGATLTATSVGITARVFQDLKKLNTPEAQIVLGAAVIDDVLGLIILAIVSAIVTVGTVGFGTIALISLKAIIFLLAAIILGSILSPYIGKFLSKIHTGLGMKFTMAMSFCLIFAYLANKVGLAPIVGAFAAGLVLDPVHFVYFKDPKIIEDIKKETEKLDQKAKAGILSIIEHHSKHHIEDLIYPLALFLVPLFFVLTGMNVKLETMFNFPILIKALGITAIAMIGKIVSGLVAGKVDKLLVGFGMVPRGEVGLIFATMGKNLNVISDEIFSIIVIMVILTTLLTPLILTFLLKRKEKTTN
jgi:Kef-type K+ transport system membrane component KefB